MKIAIVVEWFSEKMGYAENMLPKALARLGHEVHVIASTAQVYFSSPTYRETYEPFLGPNIVPAGQKPIDGFELHRLPLVRTQGMPGIEGLQQYLEKLKPEVVQTFDVSSDATYDAAVACRNLGIKLFTASHLHASVFQQRKKGWKTTLANRLRADSPEKRIRFIHSQTVCCYPIAPDAARIVSHYFHVPKSKIKIQSLGVDTDLFHPPSASDSGRAGSMRAELGFQKEDLVCIYTGRFARDKNPQCLAAAIEFLQNRGERVFGLFLGSGTPAERQEISFKKGCVLKDFVPVQELPLYYWVADAGVWPAQESTSQLDAMACGLPLVLSDKIEVLERIEGNGLLYEEGIFEDLAEKILKLKDAALRTTMSAAGINKIRSQYSWDAIARARIQDYTSLELKA